jgi:hypothetical protein
MDTMGNETRIEQIEGHAVDVSGIAIALKAMQERNFAERITGRALGLHQDLRLIVRPNEIILHRETRKIVSPRPEIAQDCQEMRIAEKRSEGPHAARPPFSQKNQDRFALSVERRLRAALSN